MITLTEEEVQYMADRILSKIYKDKKMEKYSDSEIVSILSFCIMQIGANVMASVLEDEMKRQAS